MIHTNGVESFWSMIMRGHVGAFHYYSTTVPSICTATSMSSPGGTISGRRTRAVQIAGIAQGIVGKRLHYQGLTAGGSAYPQPAWR